MRSTGIECCQIVVLEASLLEKPRLSAVPPGYTTAGESLKVVKPTSGDAAS